MLDNNENEENELKAFEILCIIISLLFCWWVYEHPIIKHSVNKIIKYF